MPKECLTGKYFHAWQTIAPRGLSRTQAAAYIGVSPSLFDQMVADGRMPKPKRINARTVWDRRKLDEAFDMLDDDSPVCDPWDEILT
jgi:predicted DNA-binding transcriptional regulator AlpA